MLQQLLWMVWAADNWASPGCGGLTDSGQWEVVCKGCPCTPAPTWCHEATLPSSMQLLPQYVFPLPFCYLCLWCSPPFIYLMHTILGMSFVHGTFSGFLPWLDHTSLRTSSNHPHVTLFSSFFQLKSCVFRTIRLLPTLDHEPQVNGVCVCLFLSVVTSQCPRHSRCLRRACWRNR